MEGPVEHDARLEVHGGRRLEGTVVLSGAKNSALKLLAASLLTSEPCVIRRTPRITDVATMVTMLGALGADVDDAGGVLRVHAGAGLSGCAPYELVRTMRASIIVMGPLVARLGEATIAMPGGCNIGPRRIDFHIRGLEKLGASVHIDHGFIRVHSDQLKGAVVALDYPSVGATENLLMAATAADGETVIENAAREPEIVDLCDFLTGMGAVIKGAGTSTVRIEGGHSLHGVDHEVVADRIEAGTYLVMGAATGGDVTALGLEPRHLERFLEKLAAMGVEVCEGERRITVRCDGPLTPVDISTLPHPGFPTDLQAQTMVLLSLAQGTSIVTENVFENRFVVVDELNRLGRRHQHERPSRSRRGSAHVERHGGGSAGPARRRRTGDGRVRGRRGHGGAGGASHPAGYEDLTGKLAALGADVTLVDGDGRTEHGRGAVLSACDGDGGAQRLTAGAREEDGHLSRLQGRVKPSRSAGSAPHACSELAPPTRRASRRACAAARGAAGATGPIAVVLAPRRPASSGAVRPRDPGQLPRRLRPRATSGRVPAWGRMPAGGGR